MLATPLSAGASGPMMRPGLWAVTAKMTMANRPLFLDEHVYKQCITPAHIVKNNITPRFATAAGMSCARKSFMRFGNSATYTLVCTGEGNKTTSQGKMTFTSLTSYAATIHTAGRIGNMNVDTTRTVKAKRVGNCGG